MNGHWDALATVLTALGGALAAFGTVAGVVLGHRSAKRRRQVDERTAVLTAGSAERDYGLRAADTADDILRGIIAELRLEVRAAREEVSSYREELHRARSETAQLRDENVKLSQQLAAATVEVEALRRQLSAATLQQ